MEIQTIIYGDLMIKHKRPLNTYLCIQIMTWQAVSQQKWNKTEIVLDMCVC